MENLDSIFASATSSSHIPGVVLAASSADGSSNYPKAFGRTSSSPDSPALATNTRFWLKSATKLFTAVAAMQCVERGLVSLDEDLSRVLPGLKNPQVLKGWDENQRLVLQQAKSSISLRMLLSDTSRLAYDFTTPVLQKYLSFVDEESGFQELLSSYVLGPLVSLWHECSAWRYRMGVLDWFGWAGLMVERLSGAQSLGAYLQEHVWTALRLDSTTFRLKDRPDIVAWLPQMVARDPSGTLVESDAFTEHLKSVTRDMAGGGMHSSAGDYLELLMALLRNNGTLLSKSSLAELLKPQVKDSEYLADERNASIFGDMWPNAKKVKCNHGLGGLVLEEDLSSGRKEGSIMWFGGSSLVWWLDPKSEVCGFFGAQMMQGTPYVIDLNTEFEKAVYETLKQIK